MSKREQIRNYVKNYLSHCRLSDGTADLISSLLHLKGKIFHDQAVFTWAEFYDYAAELFPASAEQRTAQPACAAAVELLVLATDILDDLADQDASGDILSRIAAPQAVALSSMLLTEGLRLIGRHGKPGGLTAVLEQLSTAARGQLSDISFTISRGHVPTEADYFRQIGSKSVPLTRMIFLMQLPEEPAPWLRIADYIGYAGQIGNDARDVFNDTKNDLVDKKATLPLIKAAEFSQANDRGRLLDMLAAADLRKEPRQLAEIRAYITKTGAIKYCDILAEVYIKKAIHLLQQRQKNATHQKAYTQFITFLGDGYY